MTTDIGIEYTHAGIQSDGNGSLVQKDGKFLINDLSAVESRDRVECRCTHCGHTWSYTRFDHSNPDYRCAYASDVANFEKATELRGTAYRSHHEAAGRILDQSIEGMGGAEGRKEDERLKAAVVVLWENDGCVTDAFTLRPGLRAFNHAFGYMNQCCYNSLENAFEQGVMGPEDLKVRFKEYGADADGVSNNGEMIRFFEIAAKAPIIPEPA